MTPESGPRMRGLAGKVAVVTGAANGIGRAIALRLAEERCAIGVLDLDAGNAQSLVAEVAARGGRAAAEIVDVGDFAGVGRAVEAIEQGLGPIAVLVNNAGWDRAANFLDTDPAFWDKVIRINLHGPLNVTRHIAARMAARGGGTIVNIASDAGRVGSSGEAVYSACKGGMIAFAKTLARELVGRGIRVNTVCPGPTDTAILRSFTEGPDGQKILEGLKRAIPMKRLGEPADYAGVVAFLASEDAAYITGQTISVSGGLTMAG